MTTHRRLRRASRITILVVLALGTAVLTAVVRESRSEAGSARYYGSAAALPLQKPIVDLAATPNGNGYWMVASDGGVFTFGNARFYGSTGGMRLNKPIVGMAATRNGKGYWLVASDGGVFTFGNAKFYGSTGHMRLHKPIVGMAATPNGKGYWLVASDGGVFAFAAPFRGSMGGTQLAKPINGLVAFGNGYLMVASDGGVFNFSSKAFLGSLAANPPAAPIIGIAAFATP
jgi:ribosomal protein L24E